MSKFVYVVQASHGDYSDRTEWCICALQSEAAATKYCEDAKAWLLKNPSPEWPFDDNYDRWKREEKTWEKSNPFDPPGDDHSGMNDDRVYFYSEVPLR